MSFAPLAWREIRLIGHFLITLGTRLSAAEPPVRPCVLLPKDPLRTGLVVSDTFIGAAVFSVVSQEWNGLQATQPLPPATCARSAEWTLSNGCVPLFPEKHHNIDTADSRCSTAEMRIQRRRRLIQLYCIPDPIENECCLRKIYTTGQRRIGGEMPMPTLRTGRRRKRLFHWWGSSLALLSPGQFSQRQRAIFTVFSRLLFLIVPFFLPCERLTNHNLSGDSPGSRLVSSQRRL